MGERKRLVLEWGGGLQRDAGLNAAQLGSFRDLRNVVMARGRIRQRPGMIAASDLIDEYGDPCSHVVSIEGSRTERIGIAIGYQQPTGRMYVYRVTSLGSDPELLYHEAGGGRTHWHELPAGSEPPRAFAAQMYKRVFLAHDEPVVSARAATVYYDPNEGLPIRVLKADLDSDGTDGEVKFRGVVRNLSYLFGWGYGDETNPEAPHLVRNSKPGRPLEFDPGAWFIAGQEGDPVLDCIPFQGVLGVLKEVDSQQIVGHSAETFGIFPMDPSFGVAGSHLACTDGHFLYTWANSGPRIYGARPAEGHPGIGPSDDAGIPLDLGGTDPVGLVAAGAAPYGFAYFDAYMKQVEFIFGQRGYALSLADPEKGAQWSYNEYQQTLHCVGFLPGGVSASGEDAPPAGYPKWVDTAEWPAGSIGDFAAQAIVQNMGASPGAMIDLWVKPHTRPVWQEGDLNGRWPAVPGWSRQPVPLRNLSPDVQYDVAYRYFLGGRYAEGYEGFPDAWTAATAPDSQGMFTTTAVRRVITSATWERTGAATERVVLVVEGGPETETEIEVAVKAAGVWGAYAGVAGSPFAFGVFPLIANHDVGADPEKWLKYRARSKNGGVTGPWSNEMEVWTGPQKPLGNDEQVSDHLYADQAPIISWKPALLNDPLNPNFDPDAPVDPDNALFSAQFGYPTPTHLVYLEVDSGAGFVEIVQRAYEVGVPSQVYSWVAPRPGTYDIRMRSKLVTAGTADYSDYSSVAHVVTV